MPFITFEWVKGAIVSEKNEGSEHQLHVVRVMEHYLWVSGQQQPTSYFKAWSGLRYSRLTNYYLRNRRVALWIIQDKMMWEKMRVFIRAEQILFLRPVERETTQSVTAALTAKSSSHFKTE